MGTTGRVLWVAVPELLHVGAVITTVAVMVAIMGNILFGFRAEAVSSLTCEPLSQRSTVSHLYCMKMQGLQWLLSLQSGPGHGWKVNGNAGAVYASLCYMFSLRGWHCSRAN